MPISLGCLCSNSAAVHTFLSCTLQWLVVSPGPPQILSSCTAFVLPRGDCSAIVTVLFSGEVSLGAVSFKAVQVYMSFLLGNELHAPVTLLPELEHFCGKFDVPAFAAAVATFRSRAAPTLDKGNVFRVLDDAIGRNDTQLIATALELYWLLSVFLPLSTFAVIFPPNCVVYAFLHLLLRLCSFP